MYMAPEIWKGKPYTNKVDIWGLGVALFMMLHDGAMPFRCVAEALLERVKRSTLSNQLVL